MSNEEYKLKLENLHLKYELKQKEAEEACSDYFKFRFDPDITEWVINKRKERNGEK